MDKVKLETENPYYKRNQINRTLKKIEKELSDFGLICGLQKKSKK